MTMRVRTSHRGFTLLELLVSVALFTIVVTIIMAAYVNLISLDRKARATNDLVSNLSFVVDSMSRSIRTGKNYSCAGGTNCPSGGTYFSFTDENCRSVVYLLRSDNTIGQCVGAPDLGPTCSPSLVSCNSTIATPLTDPRITVSTLRFYTQGVGTGDGLEPRVIYTVSGNIKPDSNTAPITFTIEGGATQRLLDL
jgi:prepilin-type N-terminal cleavage/methylation domain-containing protein